MKPIGDRCEGRSRASSANTDTAGCTKLGKWDGKSGLFICLSDMSVVYLTGCNLLIKRFPLLLSELWHLNFFSIVLREGTTVVCSSFENIKIIIFSKLISWFD